jgi:hypothetical protein
MTGMTMTPAQKSRAINTLTAALSIVQALPEDRACAACDHFDKGHCAKWDATVPAEAQADGCQEWVENIPF